MVAVGCGAMCGAPAVAEEARPDRRGAVVGVHFVYAVEDFDFSHSGGLSADDTPGFEVLGGYRFNRYIDVTGVFQYLSEFGIDAHGDGTVANAWGFSFMPTTRVYPFADLLPPWVEPFGLFGMGTIFVEADEGGITDSDATYAFRFAAGADFYVLPTLVVEVGGGYVVATNDLDYVGFSVTPNYAPIVAGVEYRF